MTDDNSFLNEEQRLGKATEKIDINLDMAINDISMIRNREVAKELSENNDENTLPIMELSFYCHDCRAIAETEFKQIRHKKRKLSCKKCRSIKISQGKKDSLISFYHIEKDKQ
jgi:Zn finger protein HypA/HybF involved in hydrogenase expression